MKLTDDGEEYVFANTRSHHLNSSIITDLQTMNIEDFDGHVSDDLFSWKVLLSFAVLIVLIVLTDLGYLLEGFEISLGRLILSYLPFWGG